MIDRIGQIAIRAHDLDRAVNFYRDVLGLTFLFRVPNLAFFDCGGVRLMLNVPEEKSADHPSSVLYFNAADLRTAFTEIVRRGAKPEGEPHMIARLADREVWMGFFYDSEENMMALMNEVPLRA
ncbi:MAG TPA: VOC family protein [Thermoanaerobaculia bacterium]|nr:VOC family protein [Thermoanaerobaculia bacterium]